MKGWHGTDLRAIRSVRRTKPRHVIQLTCFGLLFPSCTHISTELKTFYTLIQLWTVSHCPYAAAPEGGNKKKETNKPTSKHSCPQQRRQYYFWGFPFQQDHVDQVCLCSISLCVFAATAAAAAAAALLAK